MSELSQPPEQEAEKRRNADRDLARAYKRLWATEDGRRVLEDLEARTHYKDDPYAVGIAHGDLSYRCGTQSPIRYIHKQLAKVLAPLGRKKEQREAKSGTNRPA